MKQIGSIAKGLTLTHQISSVSAMKGKKGVSLPARPKPLSASDFAKIEDIIITTCKTEEIRRDKKIPVLDENGIPYRWEFDTEIVGIQITKTDQTDPRLIEAIQRPATIEAILYHFTRLAAHKRNTKGETGFQILLEDIANDLRYASEWAIVKACIDLRNDPSPFFPDHKTIIDKVDFYDKASKEID